MITGAHSNPAVGGRVAEDGCFEQKNVSNPLALAMGQRRTNRGTHGDSSFMLGGLPSSRENPLPLGMRNVK